MKLARRIYCIEGHWDYGAREVEPSVQPMLEQMRNMDLWPYARRDCVTLEELRYYLDREWTARCRHGSILYFATHGASGEISLSDQQVVTIEQLGAMLEECCHDCLIHFGGCRVMEAEDERLHAFLDRTCAMGISGYMTEAGWTSAVETGSRQQPVPCAPALALELLLFSTILSEGITLEDGRQFRKLHRIVEDLQQRFEDCEFKLLTRKVTGPSA